MTYHLFPNFLIDDGQYRLSQLHWEALWERIDPFERDSFDWTYPWLGTGSPNIKDGNPIFSAFSPTLVRGIRIIQEEPVGPGHDIRVWLDTYGGDIADPDHFHELVISCVLSDVTSALALSLMSSWVGGRPISFERDRAGWLLPSGRSGPSRRERLIETAA